MQLSVGIEVATCDEDYRIYIFCETWKVLIKRQNGPQSTKGQFMSTTHGTEQ